MTRRALLPVLLALWCLSLPCPAFSGNGPDLPGEAREETLTFQGMDRTYLAFIPSDISDKPPLIIVLHGSLGTGKKMRELCGFQFDRLAVGQRCIVVYPDGYRKHWNDCRTTPNDAAHRENVDDVGFIRAVIDACREKWRIDQTRVYAVGLSNGGHLCFRLASEIPDRIAGIAVMGAAMPEPDVTRCPAPRPGMPVAIINGTDDPISPFEGGMVKLLHLFRKGRVISSLASARLWLKPENRDEQPVREELPDRDPKDGTFIEKLTWPGDVACLYIVHGGGHTVPGGAQYLPGFMVGSTSRDMDAAQELWRFFQEHPKPDSGPAGN